MITNIQNYIIDVTFTNICNPLLDRNLRKIFQSADGNSV